MMTMKMIIIIVLLFEFADGQIRHLFPSIAIDFPDLGLYMKQCSQSDRAKILKLSIWARKISKFKGTKKKNSYFRDEMTENDSPFNQNSIGPSKLIWIKNCTNSYQIFT